MNTKYILDVDTSGKINYVGICTDDARLFIEHIVNKGDSNTYISQLKAINQKYGGDFFISVNNGNTKRVKSSFFEKLLRKERQKLKDIYVALGSNKNLYDANRTSLSYVLEDVKDNCNDIIMDKNCNLASRLVNLAKELRKNALIPGDIVLEGRVFFVHIVDKNNDKVSNEYFDKLESNIAKVSFHATSNHRMISNDNGAVITSTYVSGFVDFTKFAANLAELGYSLQDHDDLGFISDFYDDSGNLELSALKSCNLCYNDSLTCAFFKTEYLNKQTFADKTR